MMTDALNMMRALLTSVFQKKNDEVILESLTEDIVICGLSYGETVLGKEHVRNYLFNTINQSSRDLEFVLLEENKLSDTNAFIKYSLAHGDMSIQLCVSGVATEEDGCRRLSFLHFAWENPDQTENFFHDLAQKKVEEESQYKFTQAVLGEMKGNLCIYTFNETEKKVCLVKSTGEFDKNLNVTKEQIMEDGLIAVHPNDRSSVWSFMAEAVHKNISTSFSFRTVNGSWYNGICTTVKKQADLPLIRVLFTPISIFHDLQLQVLDMDNVGIYIIDADTEELYYANDTAFIFWNVDQCDYLGKRCYQVFWNCSKRCEWCFLNKNDNNKDNTAIFETNAGRVLSIFVCRKKWNGHNILVACARDITEEHNLQQKVEETKVEIQDLFENLPGGVIMHRWDGKNLRPLYVSKGISDLFGEDEKQLLKHTISQSFDAIHPDDRPGFQAFISSNIDKVDRLHFYRYRVWNKYLHSYIWIQTTGTVKRQPDGTSIVYTNFANVDKEVRAAEKVRKDEELLEKTCRLAHIWMFQYNVKTKRVLLSKTLQADFNLPAVIEDFPEGFLKYPIVPRHFQDLYRHMIIELDAGRDATMEIELTLPNGTSRVVRFEWHVLKEKDGKPVEVTGLPVDITKEIAERRRINKERQRLLGSDKKLISYSITDLKREVIVEAKDTSLNSGITNGDTCEEFNAKVAPFLMTEDDRQRFLEIRDPKYAIMQYELGNMEWTEDMRWKDEENHIRWRRSVYSIIENINTGELYLYCYLYDVSEEKVIQALFAGIQENLYLATAVISFITEQIYDFDGDFVNRQMIIRRYEEDRKDYVQKQVYSEDVAKVMELNRLENIKKQLASGQKDYSFVHRAMVDGEMEYHQVRYASVPGKPDICILAVRDITDLVIEGEQRNAELEKALASANAATQAKSEFLSRMSHEIRTPMNAIMGMTAIAQDNKTDFLQVTDCLSKIDLSSKYLLTLINDILEMSRIESGSTILCEERFDFVDLIEGVRTVSEPLAKKSEIRFEIINNTTNGCYLGDFIRIQQVLINLIGNAIKFTKASGRVRFGISILEETETTTTFEFLVEDTGIGMSEAFMHKMFEPFSQEDSTTTSQYGGSGLGLAISKNLVKAMGGTINAESMVGIGTNFNVQIPLKKAQRIVEVKPDQTVELTEAEQDAILKGKRVLMAEDHPMNVMVAKKLLECKGIIITVAEDGRIAVDTFKHSAPGEYDVILMDIRMPHLDGLEATKQIRALDREDAKTIPIIAMTANALEEDRNNSKSAGMNEHLAKPIDPKKLYQVLANQIVRKDV